MQAQEPGHSYRVESGWLSRRFYYLVTDTEPSQL